MKTAEEKKERKLHTTQKQDEKPQLEETHVVKQVGGSVRWTSFRHESCKRHPVQDLHKEVILR